jgi:integrin-linked kinase
VAKFNQDCQRLRIFNSANILPLIGFSVSIPDLILVSPFMLTPYGTLFNLLHQQQNDFVINLNQSIELAIHIAKGMMFLHNLDPMLPNMNLNSKHVIVDEDLIAKINMADYKFDFIDNKKCYEPAYMSPEYLKRKPCEINKKSVDMWSFAIILWELYTKQIPFSQYSPMQCGLGIVNGDLRVQLPPQMSPQFQKLIKICMNEDATKRPSFEMILPILDKLKVNSQLLSK